MVSRLLGRRNLGKDPIIYHRGVDELLHPLFPCSFQIIVSEQLSDRAHETRRPAVKTGHTRPEYSRSLPPKRVRVELQSAPEV